MAFNGSGAFSLPVVEGWPPVSGAVISSTAMKAVIEELAAGLSAVLVRDGQSAMTGILDMGGNLIQNIPYVEEAKASDLPSAATVNIGTASGRSVDVTGTTTITSFGIAPEGVWKIVRFTGALTLTHNAASLILPGAANITTAAGDILIALSLGLGNWVVVSYQKAVVTPPGYVPVNKAGDTMTGALVLSGAPTVDLHAATKKYVDDSIGVYDVLTSYAAATAPGSILAVTAGFTLATGLAAGTMFTVYCNSASDLIVTQGSGLTLRLAGTTTTGSRTLIARGLATLMALSTTEYIFAGSGVY